MPPRETVELPLDEFVKQIAREAARTVIQEHIESCPARRVRARVRRLEIRVALLLGLMVGSGVTGAGIIKLLGV